MKEIDYVVWREGKYYVAQCLEVDISSFGNSLDEAIKNLVEAVELYFEGEENMKISPTDQIILGKTAVNG